MCDELTYFRIIELLFTISISCGDEILNWYGIIYIFFPYEIDSYKLTSRVQISHTTLCRLSNLITLISIIYVRIVTIVDKSDIKMSHIIR